MMPGERMRLEMFKRPRASAPEVKRGDIIEEDGAMFEVTHVRPIMRSFMKAGQDTYPVGYRVEKRKVAPLEKTAQVCELALHFGGHVRVSEQTLHEWLGKAGYYLVQRGSVVIDGVQLYLFEDGEEYVVARRDGWSAIENTAGVLAEARRDDE